MRAKLIAIACVAVVGLVAAYAAYSTATFPRWTVDDSYILYRYADNAARHGELTWNVGGNPVEGYTGVTLVVLLAVAIKLGISPIAASHAIGVASFFLGGLLIVLILGGFNFGSAVALALYFTAPFMYTHEWSGLETTLFATAILFAVYAFKSGRRGLFVTAILILSFTRPEGALLAAIFLLAFRPFSYKVLIAFAAPLLVYFAWRWAYYGRFLPNTYYAKRAEGGMSVLEFIVFCARTWIRNPAAVPYVGSGSSALTANTMDFLTFFKDYLLRPAIVAFVLIAWRSVRESKHLVLSLIAFCAAVLYAYLPFGLEMNFSHRFLAPFYPVAVLGLGGIVARSDMRFKLALATLFLIVPQIRMNVAGMAGEKRYASTYERLMEEAHVPIGERLGNAFSPDEWLVVDADAGAIPYYSKLKTVDFGRLNDEYLAGSGRSEKEIVDYFYSRNAAALVVTRERHALEARARELGAILADPRIGGYTLVEIYGSESRSGYAEALYIRNDLLGAIAR
jgi:arabinofuranosyltransferase